MSHDLANAMRRQVLAEMWRQTVTTGQWIDVGEEGERRLTSDGDVSVAVAVRWATALNCHWEARLVTGTQPLAEGVALVRDT